MGCDIHVYVEYKDKQDRDNNWKSFGKRINPGRNYRMFGILAGVRANTPFYFEPKGIPDDLSYAAKDDYLIFISDSDEGDYCSLETAKEYAKGGCKIINNQGGKPTWVEHPDWHTPSWLTLEEYQKALTEYNSFKDALQWQEPEYEALLAAMKRLSDFNNDVRVIFWFDN